MTKAVIPPCFAPGTTSARFSTIRQHTDTQSVWEARIKMILIYYALYTSEAGSVRVSQWLRRGLAADMVSDVPDPECLIELTFHKKCTRHVSSPG